MAAHDDLNPGRGWIEVQLLDIVQDIDRRWASFYHRRRRPFGSPRSFVDIALDRDDRRQLPELGENFRLAYVTGVDNQFGASQRFERLIPQQSVGVRNEPDHSFTLRVK